MAILKRKKKRSEEEYNNLASREASRGRNPPSSTRPPARRGLRRTKKDLAKTWGKKERFLVLIVLVLTVGASAFLAISSRAWKLPGFPRLKFPSFSLSFLKEETIVIEGDEKSLEKRERADNVINAFREKTKNLSGVYSLYVTDLETGFSYGINEFETFEPASLNKLPVMAALYMEEKNGEINLENKYSLKASDKVGRAGSLYSRPEGYELTYRNLIRLMGKQSDNTAFNIVRNFLGDEKVREAINKIGMKDTSLSENETTPRDIGVFFEELWHGNIVSPEHRDELLEFLTDTVYESWITEGVPDEIRVAHKYGRETHVVNDAGIIYADEPYVLVIMSKGVVEREANDIFPELARVVYDAESR